ncbi:MAG TPA: hypothetical protein VIA06_22545 [Candidatus Dormibacteraeota bacterium]|nr:hypothetical protein [Candidatus Dormibacteraeota bacterium]
MVVNERRWPLVQVDYDGPQTMDDHRTLERSVDTYLERREPFALVFTSRPGGRGDPATTRAQVRWLEEGRDRLRGWIAAWAMVVDAKEKAAMDRGRGVGMVRRMPFPCASFVDPAEAFDWAAARIAAHVRSAR